MRINFRQGIVKYPYSGSIQKFITVSGGYATLDTVNGVTQVSFAHRASNYLFTETDTTVNAWGPLVSGDNWLYWDIDLRTGERTFGYTTVAPTYGTSRPNTAAEGTHFFNTTTAVMYVYQSGQWREVVRVFAAKVNGTTSVVSPLGSTPGFPYAGTQVGIQTQSLTGEIIFDDTGKPIKRSTGEFFTTESQFFINSSIVNAIRLEASVLNATADSNLAAFYVVKWTDFDTIDFANYADVGENAIGILTEDILASEIGPVIVQGVVTNPTWDWTNWVGDDLLPAQALPVGTALYVRDDGQLVPYDPHVLDNINYPLGHVPVARTLDATSIFFDQGLGGKGDQGEPGLDGADAEVEIATDTVQGVVRLYQAANNPADPIVIGANDPRLVDARTPLAHIHAQSDITNLPTDLANKVPLAGGTMTGFLTLNADPTAALHAATKQYVDTIVSTNIHWVAPIRDPDLQDIVSAPPTLGLGSIGDTYTFIKYGGIQGEVWVQGGTPAVVDDGDVVVFTITSTSPVLGDWIILEQGPLATGDRFIICAEHGTVGATLSGMGFVNDDLIQFNNLAAPGVLTNALNWSTPHGAPPQDGTTALVTDPDSGHYGHTYLYSDDAAAWSEIIGGAAAVVEPLNQIVYGTGTGVDSSVGFTWNDGTETLAVGNANGIITTVSGFMVVQPATSFFGNALYLSAGAASFGTGGSVEITGTNGVGSSDGGSITLDAGNAPGSGFGGTINILAGTSGSGTSGAINLQTGGFTRLSIQGNGEFQLNGLPGTSGQVLTSNGSGTAPTWSTPITVTSPLTDPSDPQPGLIFWGYETGLFSQDRRTVSLLNPAFTWGSTAYPNVKATQLYNGPANLHFVDFSIQDNNGAGKTGYIGGGVDAEFGVGGGAAWNVYNAAAAERVSMGVGDTGAGLGLPHGLYIHHSSGDDGATSDENCIAVDYAATRIFQVARDEVAGKTKLRLADFDEHTGANTAGLGGSPTAANPAKWIRIRYDGVDYVLPLWPTV